MERWVVGYGRERKKPPRKRNNTPTPEQHGCAADIIAGVPFEDHQDAHKIHSFFDHVKNTGTASCSPEKVGTTQTTDRELAEPRRANDASLAHC